MARMDMTCGVLAAAGGEKNLTLLLQILQEVQSAISGSGIRLRIMQARTMDMVKKQTSAAGTGQIPEIVLLGLPLRDYGTAPAQTSSADPGPDTREAATKAPGSGFDDLLAIAGKNPRMQILLFAGQETCDRIAYRCRKNSSNIYVFALPLRRQILSEMMRLILMSHARIRQQDADLGKLTKKISDLGIVTRAKCLLIQERDMTEAEAHYYLEKRAMDDGLTKREAAAQIIAQLEKA